MPGLDPDAITLKAAAVDRLYHTHVFRLGDAIDRIIEVMAGPPGEQIAFVEAIAPITVGDHQKWHWSFASKFAHWFIEGSLPIYDQWAVKAVAFHFGKIRWRTTAYRDLAEHIDALKEASGLSCTTSEMDRYLWLSGMYRAWVGTGDKSKLGLSGEVTGLFESRKSAVRIELARLLGGAPSR